MSTLSPPQMASAPRGRLASLFSTDSPKRGPSVPIGCSELPALGRKAKGVLELVAESDRSLAEQSFCGLPSESETQNIEV
eukprot:4929152-Amphidinium_carterae.1